MLEDTELIVPENAAAVGFKTADLAGLGCGDRPAMTWRWL